VLKHLPNFRFLIALLLFSAHLASAEGMRPVHARRTMVASVHELASETGVDMMRAGGNAVDAAVATGFALAVVHPAAGNLGGGGFLLLRLANGDVHFLDFREKAPAQASAAMYLDAKGNVIPGASQIGYRAVAVPGSVAGLVEAERRWGKLALKQVMEPAIRLARDGFRLRYADAHALRDQQLARFAESKRIFQRNGNYYEPGEIFRQPELARTLERIAEDPDGFYHGAMARELVAAIQQGGGLISTDDLANYKAIERRAVRGSYRGYQVISAPPPSAGGVALLETLNILEGYDLHALGSRSAKSIHLTVESFRRAFFDRAEFMSDPDFTPVPVAQLIDKKFAARWRESIDPVRATPSDRLQRPKFEELDQMASARAPMAVHEGGNTTHLSVVDEAGNAVAMTTTLNDSFGSRVTVPGLGFLLNDEMDDFTIKPGVANLYGLIQSAANAIRPSQRPLSSMTPAIVLKDDRLFLVLGSPGGATIISTVANIIMGVIDFGLDIQQAVNAPRFHQQWMPDELRLEKFGFSPDTLPLLTNGGYELKQTGYWGDAECIAVDPRTGDRLGASDGRNGGRAIGF
jgi:gamma-glutamyltranspeptidase/glutathione hydrolase